MQKWMIYRMFLTFPWPSFPSSQQRAHSQLLGRSSSITPEWLISGHVCFRQDGCWISKHILHSIIWFSSCSSVASEKDEVTPSPLLQISQTALFGRIGWKYKLSVLRTVQRWRKIYKTTVMTLSFYNISIIMTNPFIHLKPDWLAGITRYIGNPTTNFEIFQKAKYGKFQIHKWYKTHALPTNRNRHRTIWTDRQI